MKSDQIRKSGQVLAKKKKLGHFSKTDQRYWKERVFKKSFKKDGEDHLAQDYSVRLARLGRRESFCLHTPNKEAAAAKAAKIYICLIGKGWEETLDEFKPTAVTKVKSTVGDYLTLAESVSTASPTTFAGYARALRQLISEMEEIKSDASRFDYVNGGNEKWRHSVDRIQLSAITESKLQQWRLKRIRNAGDSPKDIASTKTSVNAMLRRCKALFSTKKIVRHICGAIELPDPLPFSDVEFFEQQPTQYNSKIDVNEIVGLAKKELGGEIGEEESSIEFHKRLETYKAFLLAVCAGLRRGEVDALKWDQIDFKNCRILLEESDTMSLKTAGSSGVVPIEPELRDVLERLKSQTPGEFVLHSFVKVKPKANYRHYRSNRHFKALIKWLKEKGILDRKPIHVLRKEAGSLINERGGLIAAQRFLRHSDARTTARHYVDVKEEVTVGLGGLLKD